MPFLQDKQAWYDNAMPLTVGLVTQPPPELTAPAAALDIEWFHEVEGELRKIPGRLRRATLAGSGAVRGMFHWLRKSSALDQMIVHTTDRAFRTLDFISFLEITSGLTGTKRNFVDYAAVGLDDKLLWADHVDVPKQYDGSLVSNLTLPATVTNARLIKSWKRRTFLFDV